MAVQVMREYVLILSAARTVTDGELTEIKKDKQLFLELVYGYTSKIGPMGNTRAGDGGKYIGRGLVPPTGKANYPRYGKLAGFYKRRFSKIPTKSHLVLKL